MGHQRTRPSHEIMSGDSADVYFARAESILEQEGMDPLVTMEVFTRQEAVLCGIDEARNLLGHVLAPADPAETLLEALEDGDLVGPKEIVLRIRARYRRFGLYETAMLGMLAQSTGWATAARECVEVAAPDPVISFGARHVHPDITDVLDYAAIVGGCVGASTPGRRPARRTEPDRHHAALAGADLRGHRGGGARVRSRPRPRGPAHRPRGHVQGRGRGGAAGRPRPGRSVVRDPSRHPIGTRARHGRPRPRGPGAAGPGGVPPREDHRVGRADSRSDPVLQGRRGAGQFLRGRVVYQRGDAHRFHRRHQGDRRHARSPSAAGSRA